MSNDIDILFVVVDNCWCSKSKDRVFYVYYMLVFVCYVINSLIIIYFCKGSLVVILKYYIFFIYMGR